MDFEDKSDNREILKLLNKARYHHNYCYEEEKAIELCDKIIKNDPENRDAMLIKAGSLSCLNKEKESYQLTTEIIKKWPDHWEAYYLIGFLLLDTNEKMAMENFNKSIELEKNFNNTIAAAQLAYFMQNGDYKLYLRYAREIGHPISKDADISPFAPLILQNSMNFDSAQKCKF